MMSNHTFFHRPFRFHWLLLLVVLLPLFSVLTGCSSGGSSTAQGMKMAPLSQMSAEGQQAPTVVQEAYRFAAANPDALKNVPCYCGCGAAGHTSNYSCYFKGVKPSGEILFDQHALGCGICVDIAQDVIKMTRAGKSPQEMRAAIDQTYAKFGPSNMAPVQ
jgi:hypothetical protein